MGARIAIVDDDATFREALQELLIDEGYQAVVWSGAEGVMELVQREHPALVVLDSRLGGSMSGEAVLVAMRAEPSLADLPVLLCTADLHLLGQQAEHLRRLRCGVLAKPFDIDELLARIRASLAGCTG